MPRISLVLVVAETPPIDDPRLLDDLRNWVTGLIESQAEEDLERCRILFLPETRIREIRGSIGLHAREIARELLRELGAEGRPFLDRESDYFFTWTSNDHPGAGWLGSLFVIPLEEPPAPLPPPPRILGRPAIPN